MDDQAKSVRRLKRSKRVTMVSGALGVAALWASFRFIAGWPGIAVGAVVALVYLVGLMASAENEAANGSGRPDPRVLLRREAWSFNDPRRNRKP